MFVVSNTVHIYSKRKEENLTAQSNIFLIFLGKFEQELNKMCSYPTDDINPGEYDAAFEKRVRVRNDIKWSRIEALLDGKLTVDQVVEQESYGYQDENLDTDGIHRGILEKALEKLKEGKNRSEIIEETVDALELI